MSSGSNFLRGLFRYPAGADAGKLPHMRKDTGKHILARIDRRLKALKLSDNAASELAGSRDLIRSIRRGIKGGTQHGVSTTTLEKLAPVLKTTPEWLMTESGSEATEDLAVGFQEAPARFDSRHTRVRIEDVLTTSERPAHPVTRIIGYVGAGAEAHFYAVSQGDLDEVPAPEGAGADTVAVEIRGTSLGALFDRWLVFYDNVQRPVTSDLIGRLCVVGLADGRVLVKKLQRAKDGLFNLISNTEEPILSVAVEWAALVRNMTPR